MPETTQLPLTRQDLHDFLRDLIVARTIHKSHQPNRKDVNVLQFNHYIGGTMVPVVEKETFDIESAQLTADKIQQTLELSLHNWLVEKGVAK